ncbi:MAG: hypothetical protein HC763_23725 [Hydrococcus sp. CRU_1_1]|nr:hypothetical protein [Hydrococcus sp. CRU_1_1]
MLSARNIENGYINFNEEYRYIEIVDFESEDKRTRVSFGDVLLTIVGAIGRATVVPNGIQRFTLQRSVAVLTPVSVTPKFLMYQLHSPRIQTELTNKAKGTAQKGVYLNKLSQIEMDIPPLNEQKRIVAKIEALQERSQRVKTELDAIKPLLDQFRQSVLAAAFRGDLTADWRENNPDVEPAEMLLHHSPQATNGLSDTWYLTTVGDIVKSLKYGTSKKCNYDVNGIPVLRIPNIVNGTIDALDLKYADLTKEEFEKVSLLPGDILMIRSNGSVSLVGRTAIVTEAEKNFAYAGYLIRIRPNHQLVNPEYLNLWFSSYEIRLQIEIPLRSTSGVNNINSDEAKRLPIPLPPLAEQLEIVRRIESLFKLADAIANQKSQIQNNLETLINQSILAKAFRGELVPQDPNDEPASVLLERIRQEKAKTQATKSKTKKTNNSNATQLNLPGFD